jgi:hypothetical protein
VDVRLHLADDLVMLRGIDHAVCLLVKPAQLRLLGDPVVGTVEGAPVIEIEKR